MDESWMFRSRPASVLADLGPLPEVVESNSETSWIAFFEAQAAQNQSPNPSQPAVSGVQPFTDGRSRLTVEEVMAEARRQNRTCPREPHWSELCALLKKMSGAEPPPAIFGVEAKQTPALVKRIRVRDQVEWAERHAQLSIVLEFFKSVPEERWHHMGD